MPVAPPPPPRVATPTPACCPPPRPIVTNTGRTPHPAFHYHAPRICGCFAHNTPFPAPHAFPAALRSTTPPAPLLQPPMAYAYVTFLGMVLVTIPTPPPLVGSVCLAGGGLYVCPYRFCLPLFEQLCMCHAAHGGLVGSFILPTPPPRAPVHTAVCCISYPSFTTHLYACCRRHLARFLPPLTFTAARTTFPTLHAPSPASISTALGRHLPAHLRRAPAHTRLAHHRTLAHFSAFSSGSTPRLLPPQCCSLLVPVYNHDMQTYTPSSAHAQHTFYNITHYRTIAALPRFPRWTAADTALPHALRLCPGWWLFAPRCLLPFQVGPLPDVARTALRCPFYRTLRCYAVQDFISPPHIAFAGV